MKNILIAFGCLALFLSLAGCATPPKRKTLSKSDQASMLMNVAIAALGEGDSTTALINLNQAKDLDSKVPMLYYLYAMAYFQKEETDLAIESARTAIRLDPKFSQAKNTLGKLLMDKGAYPEAERYLNEAAHDLTNRDAPLAKTNLGILYFKEGKLDQALVILNKVIAEEPSTSCVAAYYRGQIEFDRNELFEAQSDFEQSSKARCTQIKDAHIALSKTFIRLKKFDQARAKLIEIEQLFPHSNAAHEANQLLRELP